MTYEVKSLNEECGVFGIWGHPQAAQVTYFGLHSLQHRGQEGAGILTNDAGKLIRHRDTGLISEVFKNPQVRQLLVMFVMQQLVRLLLIIFSLSILSFTIWNLVWHITVT